MGHTRRDARTVGLVRNDYSENRSKENTQKTKDHEPVRREANLHQLQ